MTYKRTARKIRARRTRLKIRSTSAVLRLSVFRSGRHIYAQLIDDRERKTIIQASDLDLPKSEKKEKLSPVDMASRVGALIAERGKEKNIQTVVFDRGGYQYHGRIQALAEGARKAGLRF